MRIYFIDQKGDTITDYEAESIPFKIGDTINISVKNRNEAVWDIDEVDEEVMIHDIKYYLEKNYLYNGRKCTTAFTAEVEVEKRNLLK